MKNALILHGTDFYKSKTQSKNNWFPWLSKELKNLGYKVWLPELPNAWEPDIETYWNYLKKFEFNEQSILIGHSSGGTAVLGILNKLKSKQIINLAISVAGFYKDVGWNCNNLFSTQLDWKKIKHQSKKIILMYSQDDPYVKPYQNKYLAEKLSVRPLLYKDMGHFNLEYNPIFKQFPEILKLIKNNE